MSGWSSFELTATQRWNAALFLEKKCGAAFLPLESSSDFKTRVVKRLQRKGVLWKTSIAFFDWLDLEAPKFQLASSSSLSSSSSSAAASASMRLTAAAAVARKAVPPKERFKRQRSSDNSSSNTSIVSKVCVCVFI